MLCKLLFYADVLDIGNQDCICGLSCLTENGFLIDTTERCLRYTISGVVIACSVRWIALVSVLDLYLERLEAGHIVLIIEASERSSRYATWCASQQATRLPEYKLWNHELPQQDPQVTIPTVAVYKTT